MVIPSQARKLEVIKKTQYVYGKNPKKMPFPTLPGSSRIYNFVGHNFIVMAPVTEPVVAASFLD